jgi:catechol 2,3-dioxygenase-like lactoylglutathione lyase family enzyme
VNCVMDHIVLNVFDETAMIDFYRDVLQLQPERLEEFEAGQVPFPSLRLNPDTIIDLFPKEMWQKNSPGGPGRTNLNHLCIALEKPAWDKLRERLSLHSVKIVDGPVERWGAHGTGISIYFHDPEGNTVEARYYEATTMPQTCLLGS